VQCFDPSFADEKQVDAAWIDRMCAILPLQHHDVLQGMKAELSDYLALCSGCAISRKDVSKFTVQVLNWWKRRGDEVPAWAKAARIVFSFTPNSAACERVFSLLKSMFGDQQLSTLADHMTYPSCIDAPL